MVGDRFIGWDQRAPRFGAGVELPPPLPMSEEEPFVYPTRESRGSSKNYYNRHLDTGDALDRALAIKLTKALAENDARERQISGESKPSWAARITRRFRMSGKTPQAA